MRLDHVIHMVRNLDESSEDLRALGLHVMPGGKHPGWGTQNALCYTDLTYIELMSVHAPQEAVTSDIGSHALNFLRQSEGPANVAFVTTQIEAEVAAMRARGVDVRGPIDGSRRRPDGSLVTWKMAKPPWPWPFLIQWGLDEEQRRADLTERGLIVEHSIARGLRLVRVGWVVADLSAGAAWLKSVYGIAVGPPTADAELGAATADTGVGLLLCAPTAPGPAQSRMERFGEGPFLYEFVAPSVGPRLIKPEKTHGAWIRLRPLS